MMTGVGAQASAAARTAIGLIAALAALIPSYLDAGRGVAGDGIHHISSYASGHDGAGLVGGQDEREERPA